MPASDPADRPSRSLWLGVALMVAVIGGAGYSWTGSPRLLFGGALPAVTTSASHSPGPEQVNAMIRRLAARLQDQPDDANGWAMLAHAYAVLGRFPEALPAYAKAVSLNGSDANVLADYADVLGVQQGRKLAGQPTRLIERALQIDPSNLKALALAGAASFERRDYAVAVAHWEMLMQVAPPADEYRTQVQAGIDEARQLGKLPAPDGAARTAQLASSGPSASTADAADGKAPGPGQGMVAGSVRLAPALAARAAPTDTVFVFARAVDGPRMPLAVLRRQVKDLPLDFELDDSMAMAPTARLSSARQVVIGVRVSRTGSAIAQEGDLRGQSQPVAVGTRNVAIEISEIVAR